MMSNTIRAVAASMCFAITILSHAQTLTDASLTVENVKVSGTLSFPISLVFLSTNDMLVAEQYSGQVKRMTNGVVSATPVLDLPVAATGEQGLLSMIKDPQFATNNYIYVYYTRSATHDGPTDIDHRIERYTWNGTTLGSPFTVATLPSTVGSGSNHNGGVLIFGPPNVSAANQKLFAVIGDQNFNGQLSNFAAGAAPNDIAIILRINTDGTTPSDNPYFSVVGANGSLQRTYAYGIRNSFGLDFDPITNVLWETENGPSSFDEINAVAPGFNSGWRDVMGPLVGGSNESAPSRVQFGPTDTYSDPEFSWQSPIAVTAIHFVRGNGLGASYLNDCIVASVNNPSKLYKFEMNGTRTGFTLTGNLSDLIMHSSGDTDTSIVFGSSFAQPVDIDTGPDGNLYVVSLGGGTIYRIRSTTAVTDWAMY
jgi:aldose sugar dehydrogenase